MIHMSYDYRVLQQYVRKAEFEKARLVFGNGKREHFTSASALFSYFKKSGPVELTSESTVLFKDGSWLTWDKFWSNPSVDSYPQASWMLHKRPNW